MKHCTRRHYALVALVIDEDGTKWAEVCRMATSGMADVVVVFDLAALRAERKPRLEEVGTERTGEMPRQRLQLRWRKT